MLKSLTLHKDKRGMLFEILRSDDPLFNKFGQVYITVCKKGWVKGWHCHEKQTDIFCVIRGKARVVLGEVPFDNNSAIPKKIKFKEYILDAKHPSILTIPPNTWHGFECLSKEPIWIINMPDQLFDHKTPDEYRISLKEMPYKPWQSKRGG
jgi:dTDP-4-dehydrorhamnose 3,5-epimerase